jgi:Arc/MetJ-type ribon-helix-helix transcriptional regulator
MPILSLRLPDNIDAWLERVAAAAERSKSELARDAIVDYLRRAEREDFLESIARAARAPGGEDPLAVAAEAAPLAEEALALSRAAAVHEPAGRYRRRRPRRP